MSIPPSVTDFLGVTVKCKRSGRTITCSADADIKSVSKDYQLEIQRARLYVCDLTRSGLKETKGTETATKLKDSCLQNMKGAWGKEKQLIDFIIDVQGQVTLAFSDLYFNTWGKHFLRSLMRAHLLEQRNNFKDPGVQWYGGELFKKHKQLLMLSLINYLHPSLLPKLTVAMVVVLLLTLHLRVWPITTMLVEDAFMKLLSFIWQMEPLNKLVCLRKVIEFVVPHKIIVNLRCYV